MPAVTVNTCTTPEEGWVLVSHFLNNLLLVIQMQGTRGRGEEDEANKHKRVQVIDDIRAQLVGNLYMVRRRMKHYTYNDEATKMQKIIDMVIDQNVSDPEVCKAIYAKHTELNDGYRELVTGSVKTPTKHE